MITCFSFCICVFFPLPRYHHLVFKLCQHFCNLWCFWFRPILVLPPTDIQIIECDQSEAEYDFYDALFRRSKVSCSSCLCFLINFVISHLSTKSCFEWILMKKLSIFYENRSNLTSLWHKARSSTIMHLSLSYYFD